MTTIAIALAGYGVAVLGPVAVLAWGVLRHGGRLAPGPAAGVAVAAWVAAIALPLAGLVADRLRQPVRCGPGEECYDHILWVIAIPFGWLAAAAVIVLALSWGRRHSAGGARQ